MVLQELKQQRDQIRQLSAQRDWLAKRVFVLTVIVLMLGIGQLFMGLTLMTKQDKQPHMIETVRPWRK